MSDLATKECIPCKGGIPPLKGAELQTLLTQLNNDWQVVNEHHLQKRFTFKNFREALDFTNRVGELAEQQNHHPDNLIVFPSQREHMVWHHDHWREARGITHLFSIEEVVRAHERTAD